MKLDLVTLDDVSAPDNLFLDSSVLRERIVHSGELACRLVGYRRQIDAVIWDDDWKWSLQLGDAPFVLELAKGVGVLERILLQFNRADYFLQESPKSLFSFISLDQSVILLSGGQRVGFDRLGPRKAKHQWRKVREIHSGVFPS